MSNEQMLQEAPAGKLLLKMSLPMILIMTVNVLYSMADVFFLGRTGNAFQVAAVSLASPVFTTISAFNTLIGFGGCTAISLLLGQGDRDKIKKVSSFVAYSSLVLGLVLGACVLLGMSSLLFILGTNSETEEFTRQYLEILALGAPFSIMAGALGNSARADGDSKSALASSMAGTVLNIILDPLFISGFKMGPRGAALATVLGNVLACILMIRVISKKENFSLSIRDLTLKKEISLWVLSLGVPMAGGTLLMSFAHIFFNRLLVQYGNQAVAAASVAGKINMLIPMIMMGICLGIQPAISYAYGAKNYKRLQSLIKVTAVFVICVGVAMAAVVLLLREQLVTAFLPDPSVLSLGKRILVAHVIAIPIFGVYQLCSTFLQGIGKVSYATVTSLLRQGLVYIPVVYAMNALFQLNGLIYSSAVTDVIATSIAVILSLSQTKKMISRSFSSVGVQAN